MHAPLGVAVIGAGRPSIATSCHLPAMEDLPQVRVRVLCDLDETGVRKFAQTYNTRWTTRYEEVLADEKVDMVQICTPDPLHCRQTVQAARAGKHVLCQKPLACTVEELYAIRDAAKDSSVVIQAVQNNRWTDRHLRLKQLIDAGAIGDVAQVTVATQGRFFSYPADSVYRRPDGPPQFLHNGVHHVDLASWLAGSLPVEVYAQSTRHYSPNDALAGDNYTVANIRFRSGAFGLVELNQLMVEDDAVPERQHVMVAGTCGNLLLDNRKGAVVESFRKGRLAFENPPPEDAVLSFRRLIADFADNLLAGRPPSLPLADSLTVVAACLAALVSAGTGSPQPVPGFAPIRSDPMP